MWVPLFQERGRSNKHYYREGKGHGWSLQTWRAAKTSAWGSHFLIYKMRMLTRIRYFWTVVLIAELFLLMKFNKDLQSIKQEKAWIHWSINLESGHWTLLSNLFPHPSKVHNAPLWNPEGHRIQFDNYQAWKLQSHIELKEMHSTMIKSICLSFSPVAVLASLAQGRAQPGLPSPVNLSDCLVRHQPK